MKKKLLVLLIAVIPTLMPNLASAIAVEIDNAGAWPRDPMDSPMDSSDFWNSDCGCASS